MQDYNQTPFYREPNCIFKCFHVCSAIFFGLHHRHVVLQYRTLKCGHEHRWQLLFKQCGYFYGMRLTLV